MTDKTNLNNLSDRIQAALQKPINVVPYTCPLFSDKLMIFSLYVVNGTFTVVAKDKSCILVDVGLDWQQSLIGDTLAIDIHHLLSAFELKGIIITHEHVDHNKLLSAVTKSTVLRGKTFPIFRVGSKPDNFKELLNTLLPGVQIELILPKNITGGADIHVFKHLLVFIKYGSTGIFFPGDATPETLDNVEMPILFKPDENITLYYWQHHGSKNNGPTTLYGLKPRCIVFSSGNTVHYSSTNYPYGLPCQSIVETAYQMVDDSKIHEIHAFPDKMKGTSKLDPSYEHIPTNAAIYTTSLSYFLFGTRVIHGVFALVDNQNNYEIITTPYQPRASKVPENIECKFTDEADIVADALFGKQANSSQKALYERARELIFREADGVVSYQLDTAQDKLFFVFAGIYELIQLRSINQSFNKFPRLFLAFNSNTEAYVYKNQINKAMRKLYAMLKNQPISQFIGREIYRKDTISAFDFETFEEYYIKMSDILGKPDANSFIIIQFAQNFNVAMKSKIIINSSQSPIKKFDYKPEDIKSLAQRILEYQSQHLYAEIPSKNALSELIQELSKPDYNLKPFQLNESSLMIIDYIQKCLGFVGDFIFDLFKKSGILILPTLLPEQLSLHLIEILQDETQWRAFVTMPACRGYIIPPPTAAILCAANQCEISTTLCNYSPKLLAFKPLKMISEFPFSYNMEQFMKDSFFSPGWKTNRYFSSPWNIEMSSDEEEDGEEDDDLNYGGWAVTAAPIRRSTYTAGFGSSAFAPSSSSRVSVFGEPSSASRVSVFSGSAFASRGSAFSGSSYATAWKK